MIKGRRNILGSYTQQYINNQYHFVAKVYELPIEYSSNTRETVEGEYQLTASIKNFIQLMADSPSKYGIPVIIHYSDTKKSALLVRKSIQRIFSLLLYLGIGRLEGQSIILSKEEYLTACQSCNHTEELDYIELLRDAGICCTIKDGFFIFTNETYPLSVPVLFWYARKCLLLKKKPLLNFMRFDYRLFTGKVKLNIDDILYMLPGNNDRTLLRSLHEKLVSLKIKFKISDEFYRIHYYINNRDMLIITPNYYWEGNGFVSLFCRIRCIVFGDAMQIFQNALNSKPELSCEAFRCFSRCRPDCTPGYGCTGPDDCGIRQSFLINKNQLYLCSDCIAELPLAKPEDVKFVQSIIQLMSEAARFGT